MTISISIFNPKNGSIFSYICWREQIKAIFSLNINRKENETTTTTTTESNEREQ